MTLRRLLVLVALPWCLNVGATITCDLGEDTGSTLSLLQVQAHPAGVERQATGESRLPQPDSSNAIVNLEDQETLPRRLQPTSSMFRMLEQDGAKKGLEDGIAVIVPGLGDDTRAKLVKKNIAWLKSQDVPFECTIYVYRTEKEFPLKEKEFEPCQLTRHAGYWMEHLKAFPLNKTRRRWVLHLMDSIEPEKNVKLARMVEIMNANQLSHSSPTFHEWKQYPIMASQEITPGRVVGFIELHLNLFSRQYFACLQDLATDENGYGWGMDRIMPSFCEGSLGLIDEMTMEKRFRGSYEYGEAAQAMDKFLYEVQHKHPNLWMADMDGVYGQLVDPDATAYTRPIS